MEEKRWWWWRCERERERRVGEKNDDVVEVDQTRLPLILSLSLLSSHGLKERKKGEGGEKETIVLGLHSRRKRVRAKRSSLLKNALMFFSSFFYL